MSLAAHYKPLELKFKIPVLTSRGAMEYKNGFLVFVTDGNSTGVGECSFIEGLSRDNLDNLESVLGEVCSNINSWESFNETIFLSHPSICFAVETALLDLQSGGAKMLFDNQFSRGEKGIPINGLIWMGDVNFMIEQLNHKMAEGFRCLKLKVGAVDFEDECLILEGIRSEFDASEIELRLDANGAFTRDDVFKKMKKLSKFQIHSIEQPIKPNQWELMRAIVDENIIDLALDEELIGITVESQKEALLDFVNPKYIILKPSLIGGLKRSEDWMRLAGKYNIEWWATSALESNIGLNAIAQWVYNQTDDVVQGLGTGSLYLNNISSPLVVNNGYLHYDKNLKWDAI